MRISTALLIWCATLHATCLAQWQAPMNQRFDSLITKAHAADLFSGSVLIASEDRIVYQKSIGLADIAQHIANTAGTPFRIGSITKVFTKVMTLQLAEERKLRLTDKVGTHLSGFPPEIAAVTIQQLMDHTSGLGQYYEEPEYRRSDAPITSVSDLLPFIRVEKLKFKPGAKAEYSNSGYVLLAAIIEKVTKKDYGTAVRERIFNRLGMKRSGFAITTKNQPGLAVGYMTNQPGPMRDNSQMRVIGAGDGGLFSTTEDMYRFARSFTGNTVLLSTQSKLKVFSGPLFPNPSASWDEFLRTGSYAVAGGAPGISALLADNIGKKYVVIVLSNYDEGTAEGLGRRISAILNGREPDPFHVPTARFIYSLIKAKGPEYFSANYKPELQKAGITLDDDMDLLFAGRQLQEEKNLDGAVALYTVYTREFPKIVVAWNELASVYVMKGDTASARKCYQTALELRPENERARRGLDQLK